MRFRAFLLPASQLLLGFIILCQSYNHCRAPLHVQLWGVPRRPSPSIRNRPAIPVKDFPSHEPQRFGKNKDDCISEFPIFGFPKSLGNSSVQRGTAFSH
jgi:hypothetical protein